MFDFLDRNNSHLFISVETARIRHIHHQIAEYWSQRKYSKILPKKSNYVQRFINLNNI